MLAREQTAGRGRLGRTWVSPKDAGLYFSILLRPKLDSSRFPLIPLMAALAVSDALINSCDLKVDIKWPNDILVNDRKVCGILAETIETKLGRAVIVGIGINLDNRAFPPELIDSATSISGECGRHTNGEAILHALTSALACRYEELYARNGDKIIVRDWTAQSSYAEGMFVRVTLGDTTLEGYTRGVERDGALRLETAKGDLRLIRAGDVATVRAAVYPKA